MPEDKSAPKPETKAEPKSEAKVEPKSEARAKATSDLTPQLVKRVHQLYEDLGRQEVQAVEELERAERDNQTDEKRADAKPEDNAKPDEGA
jgi:H+-transporting ATPase